MTAPTAVTAPVTDCDLLAANPPDPDRIVAGVPQEEVDLPRATEACQAAVAAYPGVARLTYQLGRCLFYAGKHQEGLIQFELAAGQGYRQAHFIIGLILTRRYEGLTYDAARIERHWRAAAKLDHFNAQVSYVRAVLRGEFDGCDVADDAELLSFLEKAKPKVSYVAGLLVDDLAAKIRARKTTGGAR